MALVLEGRIGAGNDLLDSDLRDIQIVTTTTGTFLYAATGQNGGISTYQLTTSGALASLSDSSYFATSGITMGTFAVVSLDGTNRLILNGTGNDTLISYGINPDGGLSDVIVSGLPARTAETSAAVTGLVLEGGRTALYLVDGATGELDAYRSNGFGGVNATAELYGDPGNYQFASVAALETTTVAGNSYLLAADAGTGMVRSYQIDMTSGALTYRDSFGAQDGLGVAQPSAMQVVQAYGQTWVILAASGSGSLSVMQLLPGGQLQPGDHILDTLATRFGGVQALEVIEVNGQVLVLAGGADDGLSLLTLLPGGQLVHMQSLAHDFGAGLENITDIEAVVIGNQIQIFVSSGAALGLSQFSLSLDDLGLVIQSPGGAGGQVLGTGAGDLILGRGAQDRLMGQGGDDILVASDAGGVLTGGEGADIFVLSPTDGSLVVSDFRPGVDRLDMTNFPNLRSMAQLDFTATSTGIEIRFGTTTLVINSYNGSPLKAADLWPTGFDTPDRVPIPDGPVIPVITGSGGDDTLTGGEAADIIYGEAGDDVIHAGAGNDQVSGGIGDDTLYGDLGRDVLNGDAGSDVLNGGGGQDTLNGGAGNDTLNGGGGDDTLAGGTGQDSLNGGAGDDTLDGGIGHDTLIGGDGLDRLFGGIGNDTLYGDAGQDRLNGGGGNDTLAGGTGQDRLFGGAGQDRLFGGADDDTLTGGGDADRLFGGLGNDILNGGVGYDILNGGLGNDILNGGFGNDILDGGNGNDILNGEFGNDTLFGGNGNDILNGNRGDDILNGGDGQDTLNGGLGDDRLTGGNGNDTLLGRLGNDTLIGGGGDDIVWGGLGDDSLKGGTGDDILGSGRGNDTAFGGFGADTLRGGAGRDLLEGEAGDDTLYGGVGNDTLRGGIGRDTLQGGAGQDVLTGGAGQDTLRGGGGNDSLKGGDRADTLFGGTGADTLEGGRGDDTLTGGLGQDMFVFRGHNGSGTGGFGNDRILDFSRGQDRIQIDINGVAFDDLTLTRQVITTATGTTVNTVINTGSGTITVEGTAPWQLSADDFLF